MQGRDGDASPAAVLSSKKLRAFQTRCLREAWGKGGYQAFDGPSKS